MATDGPTPDPCPADIFRDGDPVILVDALPNATERWVQTVAALANARVDWHYSGGVAQVLHLGNSESRSRVDEAITQLADSLDGRIIRRLPVGADGLYRRGVTEAPTGAIAGFYAGDGSSAYIVEQSED